MATNTQAKQLQQALGNGYSGPSVQRGKDQYTPYGALIRTDGFYYPEGAKISPNGMYIDKGNGWEFAKHGVGSDGSRQPSSVTGLAPGANVMGPGESWSENDATVTPETPTVPVEQTPTTPTETPQTDAELERYWKRLFGY